MGTFRIQQATSEDTSQLADLLSLLFDQEGDFKSDSEKQIRGLRFIVEHPESGLIFLMRDGQTIVGMVNLLFTISTAEGGPVILLEDMIVHPSYRGRTLGSRLLRHAVAFAAANGFKRITLLTDRVNVDAIRFYKKHGFALSAMTPMRLSLG